MWRCGGSSTLVPRRPCPVISPARYLQNASRLNLELYRSLSDEAHEPRRNKASTLTLEQTRETAPSQMDYGLSGESIVCFAGEDWWYHFPHSKNHIMKRLARQNRVLFVNSITMGLPSVSNPDFFLKIRRKLRSYLRWLRRVPEGLYVLSPITLPLYGSKTARALNQVLLILQLRLVMLLCGMRKPIVWVASIAAVDVV